MFFEQFYKDGPSLARHIDAPLRRDSPAVRFSFAPGGRCTWPTT